MISNALHSRPTTTNPRYVENTRNPAPQDTVFSGFMAKLNGLPNEKKEEVARFACFLRILLNQPHVKKEINLNLLKTYFRNRIGVEFEAEDCCGFINISLGSREIIQKFSLDLNIDINSVWEKTRLCCVDLEKIKGLLKGGRDSEGIESISYENYKYLKHIPLVICFSEQIEETKEEEQKNDRLQELLIGDAIKKAISDQVLFVSGPTIFSGNGEVYQINGKFKASDGADVVCRHLAYDFHIKRGSRGGLDTREARQNRKLRKESFNSDWGRAVERNNVAHIPCLFNKDSDRPNINYSEFIFFKHNLSHDNSETRRAASKKLSLFHAFHEVAISLAPFVSESGTLISSRHAMGWEIKREDEKIVSLRFYDPNFLFLTKMPEVKLICSIDKLNYMGMEQLFHYANELTKRQDKVYFKGIFNVGLLIRFAQNDDSVIKHKEEDDIEWNEEEVSQILSFEMEYELCISKLEEQWDFILNSENIADRNEKIDLIKAKNIDGIPGLSRAAELGRTEVVQKFFAWVKSCDFSASERYELLAACSEQSAPPLYMAMQNGHTTAAQVYIEGIFNSDLPKEDQIRCLKSKNNAGCPALVVAMERGHLDTMEVFVDSVLGAEHFLDDEKAPLLHHSTIISSSNKQSGLYMALEESKVDVIKLFITKVLSSNLPDVMKLEILAAKNKHNEPALLLACYQGNTEAVGAYVASILANPSLPEDKQLSPGDKKSLLDARMSDGSSALRKALEENKIDIIKLFITQVLSSDLSDDIKIEIVEARKQRVPALLVACAKGNAEAVHAYVESILASPLSPECKKSLLDVRSEQGSSALMVARAVDGRINEEEKKIFPMLSNLIADSSLPDDIKNEILAP